MIYQANHTHISIVELVGVVAAMLQEAALCRWVSMSYDDVQRVRIRLLQRAAMQKLDSDLPKAQLHDKRGRAMNTNGSKQKNEGSVNSHEAEAPAPRDKGQHTMHIDIPNRNAAAGDGNRVQLGIDQTSHVAGGRWKAAKMASSMFSKGMGRLRSKPKK